MAEETRTGEGRGGEGKGGEEIGGGWMREQVMEEAETRCNARRGTSRGIKQEARMSGGRRQEARASGGMKQEARIAQMVQWRNEDHPIPVVARRRGEEEGTASSSAGPHCMIALACMASSTSPSASHPVRG